MFFWITRTHIKIVYWTSHVELIYDVNDDGGSRQEGEQDKQEKVYSQPADDPEETVHWKVLPGGHGNQNREVILRK